MHMLCGCAGLGRFFQNLLNPLMKIALCFSGSLLLLLLAGCAGETVTEETTHLPHAQPAPWEGTPAFVEAPGRYGY
jgi:hypothetical protein